MTCSPSHSEQAINQLICDVHSIWLPILGQEGSREFWCGQGFSLFLSNNGYWGGGGSGRSVKLTTPPIRLHAVLLKYRDMATTYFNFCSCEISWLKALFSLSDFKLTTHMLWKLLVTWTTQGELYVLQPCLYSQYTSLLVLPQTPSFKTSKT
jgi:hypothetical protein